MREEKDEEEKNERRKEWRKCSETGKDGTRMKVPLGREDISFFADERNTLKIFLNLSLIFQYFPCPSSP